MPVTEEQSFSCPYCTSANSVLIDLSAGSHQRFVTDCEICCRPIVVSIELSGPEVMSLIAEPE